MNRGTVSFPLLLAVIAALAAAYFFRSLTHHQPSSAAQAVMAGKASGVAATTNETDDKALSDDEEAAGAPWARKHPGQRCPGDPVAFSRGCDGVWGVKRVRAYTEPGPALKVIARI
jgi:hypothetical protein